MKLRNKTNLTLASTSALMVISTVILNNAPAAAQERQDTPVAISAINADELKFDTIIVTAQRKEQGLQDVPIAVSAFSPGDLEARQIQEALDLITYIPNATVSNNTALGTANSYFIRGLGNSESIATFDPPVGSYINSIYISRQNANNFALFDLERIEVLRGPQGTLFGRNTTGGAVNVILKDPGEEIGGFAEAGYGRFNRATFRGAVDLPISEKVLTKISAFYIKDDGFVNNTTTGETLNSEESFGVNAAAKLFLSEDITWDVSASYLDSDHANILNFTDPVTGERVAATGLSSAGFGIQQLTGPKNDLPLGNRTDTIIVSSNLSADVKGVNVEFLTGYVDLNQNFNADFLNSPADIGGFTIANIGDHKQWSQEIKLSGALLDDNLEYIVGAYYVDEDNVTDFGTVFFGSVSADRILTNETKAWAIYGQADYHLTDDLTATAGLRYTDEEKSIDFFDNRGAAGPLTTANIITAGIPVKQTARVATPRFALNYDFSDDVSAFISATRGFKSGGWNARGTAANRLTSFSPEKVWSYEAGLRSELVENTLRLNITGFYSDITDLQISSAFDFGGTRPQFLTGNFADYTVKGIEAEASWLVNENLSFYTTVGYMDAEYKNISTEVLAQQTECLAGDTTRCNGGIVTPLGAISEPVRTPDITFNFGLTHEIPVSNIGGKIVSNANMLYTSKHFVATSNPEASFAPNRAVVNAGISYVTDDESWSVSLECKNCFNKEYPTAVLVFPYLNDPSTWGLRFKYNFGARRS